MPMMANCVSRKIVAAVMSPESRGKNNDGRKNTINIFKRKQKHLNIKLIDFDFDKDISIKDYFNLVKCIFIHFHMFLF